MNENIKKVQKSVLDFWNKYDKKQKTLIVSVTLTVIIALVILALVLTKTTYEELVTCEDAATAAQEAGRRYINIASHLLKLDS